MPTPGAKRCLSCAKKKPGGAWRQLLARVRDRDGAQAARELAREQGVPYSCAASPADGKSTRRRPPAEGRRPAPPPAPEPPAEVEPLELGRLAGTALRAALVRLAEHIASDDITPGQLAQMVKPLHGIWAEVAGGTTASHVEVVFERAPDTKDAAA